MNAAIQSMSGSGPVFDLVGAAAPSGMRWAWALQDLDLRTAAAARAELMGAGSPVAEPGYLAVYLGADHLVDAHGLQVLIDVAASQRASGGDLVVVAPPHHLPQMLSELGLRGQLRLAATAQQAATWIRTRTPTQGRRRQLSAP